MKVLVPTLLIVLSVAMYMMYIAPETLTIKNMMAENSKYQELLNRTQEIAAQRDSALDVYNSFSEEEVLRLQKMVPTNFNPVRMLNDLNSLSARNALSISDFKFDKKDYTNQSQGEPAPEVSAFKSNSVSFKLTGQYGNFINFLNDLESSLQLVDVVKVTINKPGGSVGDTLDYNVEIQTYSLK